MEAGNSRAARWAVPLAWGVGVAVCAAGGALAMALAAGWVSACGPSVGAGPACGADRWTLATGWGLALVLAVAGGVGGSLRGGAARDAGAGVEASGPGRAASPAPVPVGPSGWVDGREPGAGGPTARPGGTAVAEFVEDGQEPDEPVPGGGPAGASGPAVGGRGLAPGPGRASALIASLAAHTPADAVLQWEGLGRQLADLCESCEDLAQLHGNTQRSAQAMVNLVASCRILVEGANEAIVHSGRQWADMASLMLELRTHATALAEALRPGSAQAAVVVADGQALALSEFALRCAFTFAECERQALEAGLDVHSLTHFSEALARRSEELLRMVEAGHQTAEQTALQAQALLEVGRVRG